jgi:hypothetical protein
MPARAGGPGGLGAPAGACTPLWLHACVMMTAGCLLPREGGLQGLLMVMLDDDGVGVV